MTHHDDDFIAHLLEMMTSFGDVSARKMFGGYGIYHQGLMFGLVADDVLYLKVDAESKPIFLDEGLQAFTYDSGKPGKKPVQMSYHQAPECVLDDPDDMHEWAQRGYDAAVRAKQ